jgi:hypothetical protein
MFRRCTQAFIALWFVALIGFVAFIGIPGFWMILDGDAATVASLPEFISQLVERVV